MAQLDVTSLSATLGSFYSSVYSSRIMLQKTALQKSIVIAHGRDSCLGENKAITRNPRPTTLKCAMCVMAHFYCALWLVCNI